MHEFSFKENQLDALFILSIFRQSTFTSFGRIYSYIYMVYLLMMGYKYTRNM
jgi:hypothetical protein